MCVNIGNGSGTSPSRELYPLEEWQLALAFSPHSQVEEALQVGSK